MDPNKNEPLPVDYLDQIAPKQHKSNGLLDKKPFVIFIIGAVLISLILFFVSMSSGNNKTTTTLAARLKVTNTMAIDATKKVKSDAMQAANSNLKIYLTNTIRDITPILATNGVKMESLSKDTLKLEDKTSVMTELENARLNNTYDRTYSLKMYYQINSILTLMKNIKQSSKSKSLTTFLTTSYDNLLPIQKEFYDYYNSNS